MRAVGLDGSIVASSAAPCAMVTRTGIGAPTGTGIAHGVEAHSTDPSRAFTSAPGGTVVSVTIVVVGATAFVGGESCGLGCVAGVGGEPCERATTMPPAIAQAAMRIATGMSHRALDDSAGGAARGCGAKG